MSIHDNRGSVSRRKFLAGIAAGGAAAMLPWARAAAQRNPGARGGGAAAAAGGRPFRIDTHSHFTTPQLYKLAMEHGVNQATLKDWSARQMLEQMDMGAVATSIISVSDPGVHFGDNGAARKL